MSASCISALIAVGLATGILCACAGDAPVKPFENPARLARQFGERGPQLEYLVFGDSTAAGQGADYSAGIAVGTARALAEKYRVSMTNFGVSGARIADVRQEQLPAAAALTPADLVLLSVGANDVTHLTDLDAMRADLLAIVQRLRAANPAVAIVATGAPDMGSPPRIPWLLRGIAGLRTQAVNRMFRSVAAREHFMLAPIAAATGPLFRADRSLFDADRFHPNARGYATWIDVLNRALAAALAGH